MRYRIGNVALRTSLIYSLVAVWWLLYSDRIETSLVTDSRLLGLLQANKTGLFVAVTTVLLYVVLRRQMQRSEQVGAALAASEQRLSRIISSAKDAIVIVDASRCIVIFNTSAEHMFGCVAAEAIGQPIGRFIPQLCSIPTPPYENCSINTAAILTAVRADGSEFFIEAAGAQIMDAGQPLCMVSVRDVTERKRADEALHRSEARFVATFQSSPVAQAILRRNDLHIIDVNRKMESLLGYGREELLRHDLDTIGIFSDRSRLGEFRQALQDQDALFNTELAIITKSGESRQALFSTVPFEIDNEACTLLTVQDLSKRRRAEDLMQRATERLRVLAAASNSFAQVENDYQAVLDQLAKTAAHLGDGCAISFLSDDHQYLKSAAVYDVDPQIMEVMSASIATSMVPVDSATLTAHVLRSQQAMLVSLAKPEQYCLETQSTIAAVIEERGVSIHSMLAVPLRLRGQILGVLFLYRRRPEQPPFDDDDLTLTQELSDRAALALNNARLYSSLQQSHHELEAYVAERTSKLNRTLERVQDLYAITNDAIMTEQLVDALQRTTERVRATLPADRVVLLIFDWKARRVEQIVYSHSAKQLAGSAAGRANLPFSLDEIDFEEYMSGLTGWVVSELRPAISPKDIPDPRESTIAQQRRIETQSGSIVVAPLLYLGEVFGTITAINCPDEPDFSADDVEHLTAVAGQISMVYGRNRLVAQLQQANADLARAARLKDEFLANMSHELRTPLNSILGRCQALQDHLYGELTTKQADVLRGVEDSGRHLLALINDILDLAKIAAGKLELHIVPVMVAPLCRMSVQMVAQAALKKQIEIRTSIAGPVNHFFADERRLKQILVNLLSNAVKFTPDGGSVGLDVQGDAEAQTVTFSVWDTGIGIAKEDQAMLFRQFVQIDSKLSRQYEGSGLGLAMVQQLAEAHGGSVALESEPGQGSCFRVTLPWSRDTDQPQAPLPEAKLLAAHS